MACSSCLNVPRPGVPLDEDEERRQRFGVSLLWFCFSVGRKSNEKKNLTVVQSPDTDSFVALNPSRRQRLKDNEPLRTKSNLVKVNWNPVLD